MVAAAWLLVLLIVFYPAISMLVIFLSQRFNRNLKPAAFVRPARWPQTTPRAMLKLFVEWSNFLVWSICSKLAFVDDLTRRRVKLFATDTLDLAPADQYDNDKHDEKHWVERYKATYGLLGILNHKAEALMVYSGVTLAVVSVANVHPADHCDGWRFICSWLWTEATLSKIIAVCILFSILFCLIVVGIFWGFLEYAVKPDGLHGYQVNFRAEWEQLLKVVVVRQFYYQFAWLLAVVAWLFILLFVIGYGL